MFVCVVCVVCVCCVLCVCVVCCLCVCVAVCVLCVLCALCVLIGAVLGWSWAAGCSDRTHTQIEGACFIVQVLP